MSIVICYRINRHSAKMSGVFTKLLGQIQGFLNANVDVYAMYMDFSTFRFDKFSSYDQYENIHLIENVGIEGEREAFWKHAQQTLRQYQELNIRALYCRYDQMYDGDSFYCFVSYFHNANMHTILEFPTYPYEEEVEDKAALAVDIKNRKKLVSCVDTYVSTCVDDAIDGRDFLQFNNKIDVKNSCVTLIGDKPPMKVVNLIAVANLSFWHGYDRLLEGIVLYLETHRECPLKLTIVGEGKGKRHLQDIVQRYALEEYVSFDGFKAGMELSLAYRNAHVAISSLGLHRIGLQHASPLKSRQYLANGLPVVYAYQDSELDAFQYKLQLPENDTAVDIDTLLRFAHSCWSEQNLATSIYEYALQYLDWKGFCQKLVDKI